MSDERAPIRVFFSYSHEDDRHRIRLEKALKLLERQDLIDTWTDRKLLPGDRWEEGIEQELERADLILFLVSPDFIASEFIWGHEMKRALEREEKGEARVVPVIVRPCDWHAAPFGKLQAVPTDGLAVTHSDWGSEDEAWLDVAKRLRSVVEDLARRGTAAGSSTLWSEAPDPTRYLEAMESRNSFVEIRGMGAQVAEQLPLDRVYTRLRVAGSGPEERIADPRQQRDLHDHHLELPQVLNQAPHAVLIGDPGSGKTTFLRFAAQVLARSLLARDPALANRELGLEIATPEEIPFPILLRLSRFADFLADHPDDSCPQDAPEHLLRYLEFELRGRNLGLPEDYLRRRLAAGGCFLLLDGLDEVPRTLRTRVAALVDELVATALTSPPNRHLITCRTRAYRDLARLGGLPAFPLAPFEEDQIATFIRGWSWALFQVGRRGGGDTALPDAKSYETDLLEAINSHENVGPMTESPLMLTMLAVVHWNQRKLPERRNELYEAAVTYLLESRKDHAVFPTPQRREALQALALNMFIDDEGVQRSLGLPEAGRAVAPVLQASEAQAQAFLDEEALQSGLLVSRTEGEVEFWHLCFQEYLAALELATSGDYWEILSQARRLHDDRWSEVVLLLGGCLRRFGGLRAAKRFLDKILATGTGRVGLARAVGLAGRVLADVKPYGGDPSVGTAYSAALDATLAIFKSPDQGERIVNELVRVEVGEVLGQAGDPRLANPHKNLVAIAGGTFRMGSQLMDPQEPNFDPEAYEDESPVRRVTVSPYLLGRFLVTVQEFYQFIDAGVEGFLDRRWWSKLGWRWRRQGKCDRPASWRKQLRHPNRPVTRISWYEADAYCRWVGGRLPSEAEWEFAARGNEGRRFPWGNEEPDGRRANFTYNVGAPSPVGIYPLGASPEGVQDLAGNVWEWCRDRFGPYPAHDEVDPTGPRSGYSRVSRGGAFGYPSMRLRSSFRLEFDPGKRYEFLGFRVALDHLGNHDGHPPNAAPCSGHA